MRVVDSKYELGGNSILRLTRTVILGKILPLGNFHSGPGLRCLVTLFILHRFGRPLFVVLSKYSNRSRVLRKIHHKLR